MTIPPLARPHLSELPCADARRCVCVRVSHPRHSKPRGQPRQDLPLRFCAGVGLPCIIATRNNRGNQSQAMRGQRPELVGEVHICPTSLSKAMPFRCRRSRRPSSVRIRMPAIADVGAPSLIHTTYVWRQPTATARS